MSVSGHNRRAAKRRKSSLLARYAETLGEMMLRRHTEIAIRAARQEAELNSRAKSAFLSTMSHELRTPLNAIIGFSDLMTQPGATSAASTAEYAGHIAKAGRRLLDVVSDVLDMSKLEAGSLSLNRASVAIAEVIEAAVQEMRPQFDAKKQVLDIRIDRAVGEAEIDHKRVRQVLGHLLSNACKFTGEGGRVLLMARAGAEGGVTIAIADTGIGMTHEETMLALKPFSQVDDRRARAQEGAGLGLPLALALTQLHGGSLRIESQPRSGTTVMLTLPRRAPSASTTSGSPAKPTPSLQGRAA